MTKPKLWLDLESFSTVPIEHGTHAYVEHAEILLFAYAIGDAPAKVWDCTAHSVGRLPRDLTTALLDPDVLVTAHNSHFDRTLLNHILPGLCPPLHRWRDTMAQALSHSLPASLADLCAVLKVPVDKAKAKDGRQLLLLFCKPRPKGSGIARATWQTHPEEWARFVDYGRLDVEAMREVARLMPSWNWQAKDIDLWHLDQTINDRGILMDLDLAKGAVRAVAGAQAALAKRTSDITLGAVQSATQRDALLQHIGSVWGVPLPDLQKSTLKRRAEDPDLPPEVRELFDIRLQAGSSGASKYKALLNGVSRCGRLKGTLQFRGASRTGRWSGRLFQPQNMMRPTMRRADIDLGIAALKADCADLLFDDVMSLVGNAVRGCLIAPEGKKLVVADLANIEGRKLAWLSGEEWKLQAFRDFDTCKGTNGGWYTGEEITRAAIAGTPVLLERDEKGEPIRRGPDLYKVAYARPFGLDAGEVTKLQRQIGKVMELGLGYEGGVGAFLTFAAVYGLNIEAMADAAWHVLPAAILNEARDFLAWTKSNDRSTFGLSDKAFIACEALKRMWRYAHPATTSFWKELGDNARQAIRYPGTVFKCRKVALQKSGAWLRIRLPSGHFLCYPGARIEESGAISYMGVNQYSRKWARIYTYGGKMAENVTQASSCDVLAHNMEPIELAGYDFVLTVHDEDVTEAPDRPEFNPKHLAALMASNPPWAAGLPLAAEGFECHRYRKE